MTLTVQELIDELSKFNAETPVVIGINEDFADIEEVDYDNYFGYTRKIVIK